MGSFCVANVKKHNLSVLLVLLLLTVVPDLFVRKIHCSDSQILDVEKVLTSR